MTNEVFDAARRDIPSEKVTIEVVHTLDDLMQAFAVRASAYMREQNCPYDEEYDGNDLSGVTHLIARSGREPIGTLRIRWFADFAKIERVAVHESWRSKGIAKRIWLAAGEIAARKGYRVILGHIEPKLLPYWQKVAGARPRKGRPPIVFSDRIYIEVLVDLTPPEDPIGLDSPALQLLRPEGQWDRAGVLDASATRLASVG